MWALVMKRTHTLRFDRVVPNDLRQALAPNRTGRRASQLEHRSRAQLPRQLARTHEDQQSARLLHLQFQQAQFHKLCTEVRLADRERPELVPPCRTVWHPTLGSRSVLHRTKPSDSVSSSRELECASLTVPHSIDKCPSPSCTSS